MGSHDLKALFVGRGQSAQCYYRCALPAMALGHDWIGVAGEAPRVRYVSGLVANGSARVRFEDYDVVIFQTPDIGWRPVVDALQARGISVLVEVDDYLRAIGRMKDHDFSPNFGRERVQQLELMMRLADGMIVSTDWLAKKYRALNRNIWCCQNGLDLARYELTRPERDTVTIGWAGGTGHRKAMEPWLPMVARMMDRHPNTRFVSIGDEFAMALEPYFPGRCLGLPWMAVELYPCAMTLLDIALAPAGKGLFFRGKSDLRFLEAGALGIAVVGDPAVYSTIEHGVTGMLASTPEEAASAMSELLEDPLLRSSMGEAARGWVHEHRAIRTVAAQWEAALEELRDRVAA